MPVPKEMVLRLAELARIELPPLKLNNPVFDQTNIIGNGGYLNYKDNYFVVPRVIE
jgi:Asp-tRNA(Asn)/Glu-tRNA(Gln) amidotransferase C subunit